MYYIAVAVLVVPVVSGVAAGGRRGHEPIAICFKITHVGCVMIKSGKTCRRSTKKMIKDLRKLGLSRDISIRTNLSIQQLRLTTTL